MSSTARRRILRADGLFLIVVGTIQFLLELRAYYFGVGPASGLIRDAPHTVIGFIEAHGLAIIMGVLFARAVPTRSWHLAGAAVHVLLGTANLVFWQIFIAADVLPMGYGSTAIHWILVVLQLWAAAASPARISEEVRGKALPLVGREPSV
jgi:hypothetical protein